MARFLLFPAGDESGARSARLVVARAAMVFGMVLIAEVVVVVLAWNRYVTSAGRPAYWGGVAGHLAFWNGLALSTLLGPGIAVLKGHRRFLLVGYYVVFALVSLVIGIVVDQLLIRGFWAGRLPAAVDPFVVFWLWSVVAAPVVLVVAAGLAIRRAIKPARPGSWWARISEEGERKGPSV